MLNALLDEEKLINDFFILHARVFEFFDISTFFLHLCKDVPEFLLIGDEILGLRDLHEKVFKNS